METSSAFSKLIRTLCRDPNQMGILRMQIPGGIISIDANILFVLKNVLILLDLSCGLEAVERQMLLQTSPGDGAATHSIH